MRLVCFPPPQLSSNGFCPSTPSAPLLLFGPLFPDQVKPWIPFLLPPHVILTRNMEADTQFMQEALAEARAAAAAGEVPIGAVLVYDGQILARSGNRTIRDNDPTAHAELVVLREAARRLAHFRLPATTLYVTIEPCSMCAGAIIQ